MTTSVILTISLIFAAFFTAGIYFLMPYEAEGEFMARIRFSAFLQMLSKIMPKIRSLQKLSLSETRNPTTQR